VSSYRKCAVYPSIFSWFASLHPAFVNLHFGLCQETNYWLRLGFRLSLSNFLCVSLVHKWCDGSPCSYNGKNREKIFLYFFFHQKMEKRREKYKIFPKCFHDFPQCSSCLIVEVLTSLFYLIQAGRHYKL